MSYNWTSASTPQGRERLKQILDSGIGVVLSTWPMNLYAVASIQGIYEMSGRGWFPTVDDMIEGLKSPQFLDPSPSPEPVADENGLLPCPFCGEVKYIECGNMYGNTLYKFIVTCKGCGATSCDGETDSEAIAAWNRRAGKEANP